MHQAANWLILQNLDRRVKNHRCVITLFSELLARKGAPARTDIAQGIWFRSKLRHRTSHAANTEKTNLICLGCCCCERTPTPNEANHQAVPGLPGAGSVMVDSPAAATCPAAAHAGAAGERQTPGGCLCPCCCFWTTANARQPPSPVCLITYHHNNNRPLLCPSSHLAAISWCCWRLGR